MGKKKEVEAIEEVATIEEVTEQVEEVEEVIERPYTLRNLKNKDLWAVIRILGRILPDDLKSAFVQVASGEKSIKDIGAMVACDMATMIVKNLHKAQKEVDELCADMAGITVAELDEMDFGTTPMMIMDIFEDAKNVAFFKALSKYFS